MKKARVELVVELDLDDPMEVVAMAEELECQASREQWEALVLLASAVMERASPAIANSVLHSNLLRRGR